jgi:hypothetical protein
MSDAIRVRSGSTEELTVEVSRLGIEEVVEVKLRWTSRVGASSVESTPFGTASTKRRRLRDARSSWANLASDFGYYLLFRLATFKYMS